MHSIDKKTTHEQKESNILWNVFVIKRQHAHQASSLDTKFSIKRKELQGVAIKNYEKARGWALVISNRFILTAKKPVLTKQVSDFLLEYQQAMSVLPVIYKRLYQIEPLQDLELFEGDRDNYSVLPLFY